MKASVGLRIAVAMAAMLAGLAAPVRAQNAMPFPDSLAKELAAKASNYTEVTLDRNMLNFASHFMNDKNDAQGKQIIAKLKGVYVRTYEFDKPGQYTAADLAAIRRAFAGPDWEPMVKTRSKGNTDDTDIYMKMVNGQMEGMIILDAEPKELDFVYIDGPIRPEDLGAISGNFGIPSLPQAGATPGSSNPLYRKQQKAGHP